MSDDRVEIILSDGIRMWMTIPLFIKHRQELSDAGIKLPVTKKRKARKGSVDDEQLSDSSSRDERFLSLISGEKNVRKRKILALVKGRGSAGITIDELTKSLEDKNRHDEYDSNITSGTIAGIVRNANKVGLDRDLVLYKPKKSGRLWVAGDWLLETEIPDP